MYFVLFLLHIFIKKPIHVYVYFVCLCVYDEDSVDMIVYIHISFFLSFMYFIFCSIV